MLESFERTASRAKLAEIIADRLLAEEDHLRAQWTAPDCVPSCVIDDVLPEDIAHALYAAFPDPERMILKHSFRENKHVAAQMDLYDPLLEEAVFAFQMPQVIDVVSRITGLHGMEADPHLYAGGISAMQQGAYLRPHLYAGGISAMQQGAYLRPHLDNSHDGGRERYRVLNLLYYVTPDWDERSGGSLQLWDDGPEGVPRTIHNRFNRLVLMATDKASWHSVNEVMADRTRCCISNYYFSRQAPDAVDYFHATSFRTEKGEGIADLIMRADNALRTTILKVAGRLYRNPHIYRRSEEQD